MPVVECSWWPARSTGWHAHLCPGSTIFDVLPQPQKTRAKFVLPVTNTTCLNSSFLLVNYPFQRSESLRCDPRSQADFCLCVSSQIHCWNYGGWASQHIAHLLAVSKNCTPVCWAFSLKKRRSCWRHVSRACGFSLNDCSSGDCDCPFFRKEAPR